MQKTIVYILSTNFAGSHFLSLLLGSHSQALHVGELRHMRREGRAHRNQCSICEPPESCPLRRGISPETIDRVYSTIWENTNHEWPVFIDTSKRVDWCQRFLNLEGVRSRFVHLIRDPRALVRRWLLSYTKGSQHRHARWVTMKREPRHALSVLLASRPRMYLYKWLQKNSLISRFLEPRRADSFVVTYQDLALSPEREIRRITEGVGLSFEPGQLEYWTREHHGSQKTTYEWVKKDKVRHFDVRWKEFLSDRFQASIEKDAVLRRYLASQDLHLTADGLTRSLTGVIGEGQ